MFQLHESRLFPQFAVVEVVFVNSQPLNVRLGHLTFFELPTNLFWIWEGFDLLPIRNQQIEL